jgi:type I restriction enzyme S subunit
MSTETATPTKPSGIPWLGDIPSHWEVKRIKAVVVRSENGAWGEDEAGDENDVFCYRAADFDTDRMLVTPEKLVRRNVTSDVFRRKAVRPEHLLIEKSGGGENVPVGRVVRSLLDEPAVFSNFLGLIEVDEAQADSNFMRYTFWHLYSGKVPWRSIKQTTGLQNLDTSSYFDERIALPPLPEQRAIAAFLDERTARIDGLIARKQRLVALLREKRQALITRAVTRGLDPKVKLKESGVPWLGAVPVGWEVVRLKKIAIKITKGTTPTTEGGGFVDEGEIRFIKVESIGDRMNIIDEMCARIDEAMNTALSRSQLQESDVLVSIAGAIGRIGLVPKSALPANTNQAVGIVRVNKSIALPEWVALALQCHAAQEQFALDNVQSAQANLSLGDLGNTWITLPPMIQQQVIIATVNQQTTRIDALIAKVEAAVERLVEYRVALISAAVTGKVRVS